MRYAFGGMERLLDKVSRQGIQNGYCPETAPNFDGGTGKRKMDILFD